MPLVKLFAKSTLTKSIPLVPLQTKLCDIWGTKPDTTKLLLIRCEDWTDESVKEDIYVDIRAYGKAERTREVVLENMEQNQALFKEHNLIANIRLEICEDWTDESFQEDIYVDIRAYGKAERTRDVVLENMKQIQSVFKEHNLIANIRLETYEGERYFHVPPPQQQK